MIVLVLLVLCTLFGLYIGKQHSQPGKYALFGLLSGMVILSVFTMARKALGLDTKYRKIFTVKNVNDLRKHFVLNNSRGDGSDPTGGLVDYSAMFAKKGGVIVKNVNGDVTWQDIPENTSLIKDYKHGIYLGIGNKLNDKGTVDSVRLMSRKLFRGGLFVFDVEHVPTGCSVWPAIWLNGFVGSSDQYHAGPNDPLYKEGLEKVAKTTLTVEKYSHECPDKNLTKFLDQHLSKYAGRDVYVGNWPDGGEIDVLEQTNFSPTNLTSVHTGANCELVNGYDNNYMSPGCTKDYIMGNVRSGCGQTYPGLGPYAGCPTSDREMGGAGSGGPYNGDTTTMPNGLTRYNCPACSAQNAGNTQINCPKGSFGPDFNINGGGVYAVNWTPKKVLNIWFWSAGQFTRKSLEKSGGPLSDNPDPSSWTAEQYPTVESAPGYFKPQTVLVASWFLNGPNANTKGCDLNYQGIIVNITLGGGWGGAVMPGYCQTEGKQTAWADYIKNCIDANPEKAKNTGGYDKDVRCYDGAFSEANRGELAKPMFFSEAYFKIRKMSAFQTDTDDNIW